MSSIGKGMGHQWETWVRREGEGAPKMRRKEPGRKVGSFYPEGAGGEGSPNTIKSELKAVEVMRF